MKASDIQNSAEFLTRLQDTIYDEVPDNVAFTGSGEITVTKQIDTQLDGKFSLGVVIITGKDDVMDDYPSRPVEGTFSLFFRDSEDISVNAKLTVVIEQYPG